MPFTIPALKIYVYSPNLTYDIELKDKEKNYEKLTIDKFHKKYNLNFIIDEISQNIFLLKSNVKRNHHLTKIQYWYNSIRKISKRKEKSIKLFHDSIYS